MAKDLFSRYVWLVDTIYRSGKITFEEINARWVRTDMSGGQEMPLRTFHNHRKAIEELFDINIECLRRGGYHYYIENREDLERNSLRNWLLDSFAVENLVSGSHSLKRRILLEEIPSGRRYLLPLVEAMREGQALLFTYRSYHREEANIFEMEPYCLKLFQRRWYVVGHLPAEGCLRIYALDRVLGLKPSGRTFVCPDDFDPQEYFRHSFGIIVDEEYDVEQVRLRVYGTQSRYVRDLPLHPTQEEVATTDEYADFQYQLYPTYDFCQYLLAQGEKMEVLAPEWLRDDIKVTILEMARHYL